MPKDIFYRLSEEKRKRIKDGAIETFNRLSYDKVTVADIIADCKIPRGSFYMYFEDKFDVFMYLISVIQEDKMTFMKPVIERVGKEPFIDVYPDMFKAGLDFARSYPKLYRFGYHLFYAQDNKVKEVQEHFMELGISMIESFIKEDQKLGYTRGDVNPRIIATILHQLNARDVVDMFYEGKTDKEICDFVNEALKIMRHGIEREA